jgi:hypothetical protein
MEKAEKILVFNNEIEAKLIEEILTEKGIPFFIRSYHDSVYDGLFQVQAGWGHLEAPAAYKEEILNIYAEMTKSDDYESGNNQ